MITIDLCNQQVPDADPKAIQQINFTANLETNSLVFFIIEKGKETNYVFHKEQLEHCK